MLELLLLEFTDEELLLFDELLLLELLFDELLLFDTSLLGGSVVRISRLVSVPLPSPSFLMEVVVPFSVLI